MAVYKALTIAGSDSSGGAGIQADLKTFQEYGVYGMTALTTIVTMDPNDWNHHVYPVSIDVLKAQLKTILSTGVQAMKTGMLGSEEVIQLAAETIEQYRIERVVIDPVMICKGTDEVLHPETATALRELLVPKATVVTPNLIEAAQLSKNGPIRTVDDMKEAAAIIHELGAQYVVIKGGSRLNHEKAVDVLYDGKTFELFEADLAETGYTHGAGCTFSAAITAELAKGRSVREAVQSAKTFITEAIRHGFSLNAHVGPVRQSALRLYR